MPGTQMMMLRWKAFRWAGILIPVTYYAFGDWGFAFTVALLPLSILAVLFLGNFGIRNPQGTPPPFRHLTDSTEETEKSWDTTSISYLVACLTTTLLFSRSIAIAAMVFLALGGPAARIVGTRFGRIRFLGQSLEGSLACFLACLLPGTLLLLLPGLELAWILVLGGSLAAALMGLLPLPVDHHLTVPLVSASVMSLVRLFL